MRHPGTPAPGADITQVFACGPRLPYVIAIAADLDEPCDIARLECSLGVTQMGDPTMQTVVSNFYHPGAIEPYRTDFVCDVPLGSSVPSIGAVKEEVSKRAPRLYAATGGVEFPVNAAVVFHLSPDKPRPADGAGYAEAAVDASIAPFTLGGHAFRVQLKLVRTQWNWDDTSRVPRGWAEQQSVFTAADAAGAQGMVYDQQRRPCESNLKCRRYLSHAWYRVGPARVTVRTYWVGSFSVDGGVAIPIPGEIYTDSPSPKIINLKSYRTVLLDPDIDPNYRPGD